VKIVVTGGAGFIGSNIAEYWNNNGQEVVVIDNLRSGYASNIEKFENVTLIKESITKRDAVFDSLKNADYVFNLAALVSVPESIDKPLECVDINVKGLINLLDACKEHKVKKIVHSSSAAVYGDKPELPKIVSMVPAPKTPYAITKLDGEYYLNMYKEQYGLNTLSLRYFNVFGPRQNPKSQYAAAIPIFIEKALNNENITIYGDGKQTRDFIFVKDVVKANVLGAENERINGVFNVACGNSITIEKLALKIIELTGSNSKIIFEQERKGDIKFSLASIERTKEQLGFSPDVKLEQGLLKTISYFKGIEKNLAQQAAKKMI